MQTDLIQDPRRQAEICNACRYCEGYCAVFAALRCYWVSVDGTRTTWSHLSAASIGAANLKNLKGGHGIGCNFEDEDRFNHARRHVHQAVMYGFLLCFASTTSGTVLHYPFDMPAPYGFWSLPKFLGHSGGILLTLGGR